MAISYLPIEPFFPYQHPAGITYEDDQGNTTMINSDHPDSQLYHAHDFKAIVNNYRHSPEGQRFLEYAVGHGKGHLHLEGREGAGDLEDRVVAAVLHDGKQAVLLGNYGGGKDFTDRVAEFAYRHTLSAREALEYVLTHEFGHLAGYLTEESNEQFLAEYFQKVAKEAYQEENEEGQQKYERLASVAEQRAEEAADAGK